MANSFVTVPNVLPGNVTIGGNLAVQGNVLTVGSFTEKLRLAVDSANQAKLSWNQQGGGSTRDNAAKLAQALFLGSGAGLPDYELQNSAGSLTDTAQPTTIFSDYTAHGHTGTTTLDQIYTKTIRANLIGANGALRITLGIRVTTQGATPSTVIINFGGNQVLAGTLLTADAGNDVVMQGIMFNVNSASSQNAFGLRNGAGAGSVMSGSTAATNSAADAALQIAVQNAAVGDNQTFKFVSIELLNTYGPVT